MAEHDMDWDRRRFKDVVKGKVREDLRKYISQGENIVRRYKDRDGNVREKVLVPMPHVNMPRFVFNNKQSGGVGQGDGEEGDPLSEEEGDDPGKPGDKPGEHGFEEFEIENFVDLVIEECELPDLTEKGKRYIIDIKYIFRGIQRHGPKGLLHKRRTLKKTVLRQLSEGTYDPAKPIMIPEKDDFVYKGPKPRIIEGMQAVIFYMMDCSGSMGSEQKEMARVLMFWLSRCIKRFYKQIEEVHIIHDSDAKEVERDAFFTTTSSGGTQISSALKLALEIVAERYPIKDYNIYFFLISDGDNLDVDNARCVKLLQNKMLKEVANMLGYIQVKSYYGSGRFRDILEKSFSGAIKEKIRIANMAGTDDTMQAIKKLLGKKK